MLTAAHVRAPVLGCMRATSLVGLLELVNALPHVVPLQAAAHPLFAVSPLPCSVS